MHDQTKVEPIQAKPGQPAADPAAVYDPEHLNQAIRLTSRSTWILLTGLGLCVAGIIVWGILGRLAFHAQGQGVIMLRSGEVANVVARAGGTVSEIHIKPGQKVRAGDLLVSIKLDEISERLSNAKLAFQSQRAELTKYADTSVADISRRNADLQQLLTSMKKDLAAASKNRDILQQLYTTYQSDLQRGLATREQVQSAFDRLANADQSIHEMNEKISSAQTAQIEFENTVGRNMSELRMKVIEAESTYNDLQVQFNIGSSIKSPVAGIVSEVTTQLNETVATAEKLAVIEAGGSSTNLLVHAYLPIDQGKRVRNGMPAEISPTSVDDRIYGSIRGAVTAVSALPMSRDGLLAVLGDPALVATMMEAGAPIEVEIELETDPQTTDGLRWTSMVSPPTPITPGTTVMAKIVVDRVSPVSLILPIAEIWTR